VYEVRVTLTVIELLAPGAIVVEPADNAITGTGAGFTVTTDVADAAPERAVITAVPAATDVTTAPVPEPATVATARLSLDH
jgi:hypothetical protein